MFTFELCLKLHHGVVFQCNWFLYMEFQRMQQFLQIDEHETCRFADHRMSMSDSNVFESKTVNMDGIERKERLNVDIVG